MDSIFAFKVFHLLSVLTTSNIFFIYIFFIYNKKTKQTKLNYSSLLLLKISIGSHILYDNKFYTTSTSFRIIRF